MDLFQLWAFAPGGDQPTILPQPMKVDAGFVLSDVSSMTITYPLDAPGHEMLDGYCDVELRYLSGGAWVCPPQGRFLVADWQTDPVQESVQPTRTYTLVSWSWLLSGVLQSRTDILDSSGNREFINQSPAEVVATLVAEASAAGFCNTFTVDNLVATGGWAPSYAPGKAVSDILSESRDQGFLEWLIQPDAESCGRKLVLYDTVGVDRSVGDNPVTLRIGRDLVQAPSKRSMRDMAPSTLVAGDDQHYLELTNPGADLPYGMMQTYVSAAGITDLGALQTVAQARLDKGATVRAELTRQVTFDTAAFLPFLNYSLGDTILAPNDQGQLVPLRVRQITLTFEGRWSGNLVLGDRFSERTLSMDRKLRQLTAPSVWGGGRNTAMPAPPIMDNTTPPVSSALTATSKLTMVTLTWNGKDELGNAVGAGFDHAEAERDTSGSFPNPVNVGTFGSAGVINDGPFAIGSTYYYRLVIVNASGVRAAASAAVAVTVVGVKGPDLEANSVTANKMSVGSLDAISGNLGTITAGSITGTTMTVGSGGTQVSIYGSGTSDGFIDLGYYTSIKAVNDGSGLQIVTASGSNFARIDTSTSGTVHVSAGTSGGSGLLTIGAATVLRGSGSLTLGGGADITMVGDVSMDLLAFSRLANPGTGTGDTLVRDATYGYIYRQTSSLRYKQDVVDLTEYERVLDLRPRFYRYRTEADGPLRIGLMAEETFDVMPELVTLNADGQPDGVQYAQGWINLLPLVKELWADYKARSAA